MPGFDRGDKAPAVLQLAELDFAGAAVALRLLLVAGAEAKLVPLAGIVAGVEMHTFVRCRQDLHPLAAWRRDGPEVVHDVQAFIDDFGRPALARRLAGDLV